MTSFLFMLSFIIHIVILFIVYLLYQQIQNLKLERHRDIENALHSFLEEIRKENMYLEAQLNNEKTIEAVSEQDEQSYTAKANGTKQSIDIQQYNDQQEKKNNAYSPVFQKNDQVETSIEGKIFHLYHEGMPIDTIAQKLNRGKREVELIVKLSAKNVQNT